MYFFTSDLHFNDLETIKNDNRPFKTTKSFNRFIVKTWNKQAKKADTIFVVGDFFDCDDETCTDWKKTSKIAKQIKANLVLILGNNEERIIKYFFDNDFEKFKQYCLNIGFKEVYKNLEIEFGGNKLYLVHKPIHHKEGMLNLFGHMHRGGGIYKPFGFNIGCDLNHFRLYSEQDITHLISMKNNYWDNDKNIHMW